MALFLTGMVLGCLAVVALIIIALLLPAKGGHR